MKGRVGDGDGDGYGDGDGDGDGLSSLWSFLQCYGGVRDLDVEICG